MENFTLFRFLRRTLHALTLVARSWYMYVCRYTYCVYIYMTTNFKSATGTLFNLWGGGGSEKPLKYDRGHMYNVLTFCWQDMIANNLHMLLPHIYQPFQPVVWKEGGWLTEGTTRYTYIVVTKVLATGLFQRALCPLVPPQKRQSGLWFNLKTNIFLTPTSTTWT